MPEAVPEFVLVLLAVVLVVAAMVYPVALQYPRWSTVLMAQAVAALELKIVLLTLFTELVMVVAAV